MPNAAILFEQLLFALKFDEWKNEAMHDVMVILFTTEPIMKYEFFKTMW